MAKLSIDSFKKPSSRSIRFIAPLIATAWVMSWSGARSQNGSDSINDRREINPRISDLQASGAIGDGLTDDTVKVNAYLATFPKGARVWLPHGKRYLIDSGNLVVPASVVVEGASSPQSPDGAILLSGLSGFILNPAYTIRLGSGAQLRDLFIQRLGLIANPSAAQVISAVDQWGREHSVAVTIPSNTGGTFLSDLFIEGFNTCVKANAGQFSMLQVSGDCYNGIEVTGAGDNHYIDNVRFEPYYALATPVTSGSWARPGIAFNFHDGNTGTFLTRAFSFMYASGVVLSNVGATRISDSGFEWQAKVGNGIRGTKGIRWINHNAGTSASNTYSSGFDTPISDEGVGEVIMAGITAPASHTTTTFNLAGQPAVPSTITIGGLVSAGNTISLLLTSSLIMGSSRTLTYTTRVGDSISTAASALAQLINADQILIEAGIFAGATSGVVSINWPATTSVTVRTALSGDMTATSGSGPQPAGSYGAIIGATTVGADGNHPIYTFGPHVFSWHIDTPFTGDNILPANWASVDITSISRVAFTGVRWSADPSLSNCGGNAPSLNATANDASGTMTEGTAAQGCTLKFHTAWPWTPECIISSPTGSFVTRYSVTPITLTIANPMASGNKYTYRCTL